MHIRPFWGGPQFGSAAVTVGFTDGVATCGEGDGLFVIHPHAGKGDAHVVGGFQGIRVAIHPFRVDVNKPHHHRGQRVLQIPFTTVTAPFAAARRQPLFLGAPVDIFFRMPDVLAATGKTEGLEPHGFISDVARQDHQVGPGDLVAVFLFDGPQQAARLVEVAVVWPAVEGGEALVAGVGTATAVGGAIAACGVPGHADHQAAVVPPVGRPPGLAVGHQGMEVGLEGVVIEAAEGISIIERLIHRIGLAVMLVQDVEVEGIGPPNLRLLAGGSIGSVCKRALTGPMSVFVHSLCPLNNLTL